VVTSGNFSPELGHGIALAFVPPDVSVGDELVIDVRGSDLAATVVKTPFVTPTPIPTTTP
jgi:aminomethyltransferase